MEGEEASDVESQHYNADIQRKRKYPSRNEETIYKGRCNERIHELAEPRRWNLLNTYRDYRKNFQSDRVQAMKEKVQEMFGMTPEETELYFTTLRDKKPKKVDIKLIRSRIRRQRKEAKREALKVFQCIFRKSIYYASLHAPPLLVSPMVRIVADRMLQILADLHRVPVPKRTNTDPLPALLISIADWVAVFATNIYYELEVQERKDECQRKANALLSCSSSSITSVEEGAETEQIEKQRKVTNYQSSDGDSDRELADTSERAPEEEGEEYAGEDEA